MKTTTVPKMGNGKGKNKGKKEKENFVAANNVKNNKNNVADQSFK